jgi:TetR/AcrR family transcriptional regulator, ethionamide resistance regulator
MASVTKTRTRHRQRRAAAAARILEATERLLAEGERFTEIPVERLLTEADVSRSTFYLHYADKSVLLMAVAEQAIQDVTTAAELWWRYDHSAGPEGAENTIREMIKVYRRHTGVLRTLAEVGAYDDDVREFWGDRRDRYSDVLRDRYRDEQAKGVIPADVELDTTATVVGQLVDAAILDHLVHGSPRKDRQLAQTLARMGWLAYYGRVPTDD